MKSKEGLQAIREEAETLKNKLSELTEEELKQVTGGITLIGFQGTVPIITCDGYSRNIVGTDYVYRNDDRKAYLIISLDDYWNRSTYWLSQMDNPQVIFSVTVEKGNNIVSYLSAIL